MDALEWPLGLMNMVKLVYLQQAYVFELSSLIFWDVGGLADGAISTFDHLVDGLKLCMRQLANDPSSLMDTIFRSLDMLF